MEEPEFEQRSYRPKTPISAATLKKIDAHYSRGLTRWKARYQGLLSKHRGNREHFNIAVTQLFETYEKGQQGALPFLDKVIACKPRAACRQIVCPACRDKTQEDAAKKALKAFGNDNADEIKFMTLLIKVEKDASNLPNLMRGFRLDLQNRLRNNQAGLNTQSSPLKFVGAFEVDLKNAGTQSDASTRSRELIKQIGYDRNLWPSQYLLHMHAIVGPLDGARKDLLENLIEKSLGKKLVPYQLEFKSLHKDNAKDENITRLAHYMYKARLQFANNVFENNVMQKRTKYHTPYKGKVLVDYLKVIDNMQNFKGLKFDYGIR